ncbi:Sulfate and thiosulfate import ATP-binding protein CysA [Lachnospiraceae bacterium TWA4]|nr:Sulfate and thiosulfate import ATP-binding protein CysA [Lachnospiraceae bacterium TWA4]
MGQQNKNYVELKAINKYYKDYHASKDINFGIEKGKLVALLGPSGSGKTTILRMIAGLETADEGEILIDGKVVNDVAVNKRGVGFVFQSYALFRYKTVYDNIAFGLRVDKWKKADIKKRVEEMIELVGLKGLGNRYPNQLSGGQRQRVAFARALAPNPELLLLDEPFAAIDAKVRQELRTWLREMIGKLGITSIFVTHDQDEAIEVADEIIITNKGKIEQMGTPVDIYRNPKTAFVAQFMGHPTKIEHIHRFRGFDGLDDRLQAVIRPENVRITKQNESMQYEISAEEGVVEQILFRGKEIEIWARIHGALIQGMRRIEEEPVEIGESVKVFIYRAYVFGEDEVVETIENAALSSSEFVI